MKRSLYQCFNARVKNDRIYCSKGHKIGTAEDGTLPLVKLVRGASLELSICQECADYEEMEPPIPKEERGWTSYSMATSQPTARLSGWQKNS